MGSAGIRALYETAGPIVFRRCRQMLGTEEAALDAAQWVFLRALEVGFEHRTAPESLSWLYQTATRRCLHVLRTERRRREIRAEKLWNPALAAQGFEERVLSRDLLERALDAVDERTAEVALLTLVQELPVARAAQLLGVSERTVLRERKCFVDRVRDLMEGT